jgi:hypothetical protein
MANQLESDPEAGVTTLISGIVQDARALFLEQMKLFQVEVKNDIHRATTALVPLVAGLGVLLAGLVLLGAGGAYFLCWAAPELPLWVAFALVGGLTAGVGALLVLWAKAMLDTVNPIPETALTGLQENIQWKTKN